ncbi:MAG TPA: bifunctional precorrin-2 dehydrogenase/sirohydrochlorin ferrochelatase [Acidimicrobiales bacterium]|jgi:siroheme synthase-like protein|nr:bifunctional precorrin-2 dehydrogenase/sirohydrochlorin ferrochelatase [Acidimicrobiales bacterium]
MTDPAPNPTSFYPVSLDVTGRACLVVGGGPVAARKARTLLECGAAVTVIAPSLSADMEALSGQLEQIERRAYASGDAARFRLVVTATGRPEVDGAAHADAETAGVWVNSADDRAHSSFILPAVHRDGPVVVAVSTSGLSPALASWLRDRLAAECGDGAGVVAQLFGEARERLRLAGRRSDSVDWAALLDGPLLELVQSGEWDKARTIVAAATTE